MKFIKRSTRLRPKVSLILLDWSVRESFHLLHYLSKQNVERDLFEVIIVEYYDRISEHVLKFDSQVDAWLLLEMPDSCYYHKHLMYNAGIVEASGDICVICDSDAMVKEGFIKSIIGQFTHNPNIVLHLDQFRNNRVDFYPFCYPDFSDVIGKGCINNIDGRTRGIVDARDTIHARNYGACMCARRSDLISIGGSDEHIDFLGHICGPYDMTFRLVNLGRCEIWHQAEFLYHTWHPGQAGESNYLGPHDGRHISTTALDALVDGRIMPLVENESIRNLRLSIDEYDNKSFKVNSKYTIDWQKKILNQEGEATKVFFYKQLWSRYIIDRSTNDFSAYPKFLEHPQLSPFREKMKIFAASEEAIHLRIQESIPFRIRVLLLPLAIFIYFTNTIFFAGIYVQRRSWWIIKKFEIS